LVWLHDIGYAEPVADRAFSHGPLVLGSGSRDPDDKLAEGTMVEVGVGV